MFKIRIHPVDTDNPLFISLLSNSNPNPNLNPKFVERRGILHLFRPLIRHSSSSDSSTSTNRSTLLLIVAIPNYLSSDNLLRYFGSHITNVSEFFVIRNNGMEDRYSVLIRTSNQQTADAFYRSLNGKRFSPFEVKICHILFVLSVEFTELAEIASTPPPGYVELPTCPICLERLDKDTSGIQSTLSDHSFDCSCISKWTYLSCQVCRLCQQQDDRPNCSVCDTSEDIWVCIICGFVGCGRYQGGHLLRHWKDTQHCFSLNLKTQRIWDYEGEKFANRVNRSKADGKSVVVDSHCMSYDGDCGTCGEMRGAVYSSKVEAIIDEYNHRLATQLENQRQYYESLFVEAKSKEENIIAEAVEKAVTTRMQDMQCRLEKYEEERKAVSDNTSASTSSGKYELDGKWVKFRKCNCDPLQWYDVKVSLSKNNPERPFYKCVGCGEFDWIYAHDMMKTNCGVSEEDRGTAPSLSNEVNGLRATVEAMAKSASFVVKMAALLYLVLLICVML